MKLLKICIFSLFVILANQANALTVHDFLKKAEYRDVKISPDGKHIAISLVTEEDSTILFVNSKTFKPTGRLGFDDDVEPGDFHWANNERVILQLLEIEPWNTHPNYYGQMLSVNIDGSKAETVYGYKNAESSLGGGIAKKRKKAIRGWGHVLDTLATDDQNVLLESIPYARDDSSHPSIFKLNVYNGKITQRLGTSPVERGGFLSDGKGNVLHAIGFNENNEKEIYYRSTNDSPWKKVNSQEISFVAKLISVTDNKNEILVADNNSEGIWSLFKLNLITGSYSKQISNNQYEIHRIYTNPNTGKVVGFRQDNGYPTFHSLNLDPDGSGLFEKLMTVFKNRTFRITSQSLDGSSTIISTSSDVEPAAYYLYKSNTNKLVKLFSTKSHIQANQLAQMIPITFPTSDSTTIHGYLTLPKAKAKKHKAVVLIHGGPHGVRDTWGFDNDVQILANAGYAVLQINYRGSGGYGKKFETDGFRQWGGLMQQDIIDGTKWLASQPDIDKNNICIMGTSFGAYSAAMSATLAPELYQCVVANAGVYDLPLLFEEGDIHTSFAGIHYLNDVLGEDLQQLANFSPVNRTEFFNAPILIAHGEKDRRAPIEHAHRLRKALEKSNKNFTWLVVDKEDHGFYSTQSRLEYWDQVLKFLSKHL